MKIQKLAHGGTCDLEGDDLKIQKLAHGGTFDLEGDKLETPAQGS